MGTIVDTSKVNKMPSFIKNCRKLWSAPYVFSPMKQLKLAHVIHHRFMSSKKEHVYKQHILPWKTQDQLNQHMLQNILYQDQNMYIVNKPPEVPMHPLKYHDGLPLDTKLPDHACINMQQSFYFLHKHFDLEEEDKVHVCLNQNRMTSGIVVVLKSKNAIKKIGKYFVTLRTLKIKSAQKYWVLTVGIPQPWNDEGTLFLEKVTCGDREIATFVDKPSRNKIVNALQSSSSYRYTTLAHNPELNTALVEIELSSTKMDAASLLMLRAKAPILGDHLYSNRLRTLSGEKMLLNAEYTKQQGQILPVELQRALSITQNQSHTIPLHLHASCLSLPKQILTPHQRFSQVPQYYIAAPLPYTFKWSMDALSLSKNINSVEDYEQQHTKLVDLSKKNQQKDDKMHIVNN